MAAFGEMSLEEYHARQRANEAHNQWSRRVAESQAEQRALRDARRHLERAMQLLDRQTNPEAWSELEQGIAKLKIIKP
jgi:hypothetical protein